MISLKKQTIIIIDGPMGSGKTTISNIIHKRIKKMVYLGTDKIKWLQSDFKRKDNEISISLEVIFSMMKAYLKNGMNILLVENFINKKARDKVISLSEKNNVRLFIYNLTASKRTLLIRLHKRGKEHEKKGLPPISKSFILRNLELHSKNKEISAKTINTSERTSEEIATAILKEVTT